MLCFDPGRDSDSGTLKAQGGSGTVDGDADGVLLITSNGEAFDFRGLAEIRSCRRWGDGVQSAGLTGLGLGSSKVGLCSADGTSFKSAGNTFLCFFGPVNLINSNGFGGGQGKLLVRDGNSF